jgi:hypothetical protein
MTGQTTIGAGVEVRVGDHWQLGTCTLKVTDGVTRPVTDGSLLWDLTHSKASTWFAVHTDAGLITADPRDVNPRSA